jgi:hypothetical protein
MRVFAAVGAVALMTVSIAQPDPSAIADAAIISAVSAMRPCRLRAHHGHSRGLLHGFVRLHSGLTVLSLSFMVFRPPPPLHPPQPAATAWGFLSSVYRLNRA